MQPHLPRLQPELHRLVCVHACGKKYLVRTQSLAVPHLKFFMVKEMENLLCRNRVVEYKDRRISPICVKKKVKPSWLNPLIGQNESVDYEAARHNVNLNEILFKTGRISHTT
jgi:hypothetical protein